MARTAFRYSSAASRRISGRLTLSAAIAVRPKRNGDVSASSRGAPGYQGVQLTTEIDVGVANRGKLTLRKGRAVGMHDRRRRIVEAARALIRETGSTGMSMRALAARAGVSLATPYNLFGSKNAIILAVLKDACRVEELFAASHATGAIERIYAAMDISIEFYRSEPRLHKTLWQAVFDASNEIKTDVLGPVRQAFWSRLIADAVAAGALRDEVDPSVLQRQFDLLLRSSMQGWVTGEISDELLGPTMRYGLSLMLCGTATRARRPWLRRQLQVCQTTVQLASAGTGETARRFCGR